MGCEQIPDWLQGVGTLFIGGATVFGACVAWKGWKKQLRGQNEYELASKLLAGTYKMRDDLDLLRSPFKYAAEIGEDPPSASNEAQLRAYENNWNRIIETKHEIYEALVDAEAIWGEDIKELFDRFFFHAAHCSVSARETLHHVLGSQELSPDSEQYDQEQKEIIDKIEAYLKPKLKS